MNQIKEKHKKRPVSLKKPASLKHIFSGKSRFYGIYTLFTITFVNPYLRVFHTLTYVCKARKRHPN